MLDLDGGLTEEEIGDELVTMRAHSHEVAAFTLTQLTISVAGSP
jgi:hypothetical protein